MRIQNPEMDVSHTVNRSALGLSASIVRLLSLVFGIVTNIWATSGLPN
jgi:hypothetical protein